MTFDAPLATRIGCCVAVFALAACDKPGPLSAAARGTEPPQPPAWSAPFTGRTLASTFPTRFSCVGSVDGATNRFKGFRRVVGWGWNRTAARPVDRVMIVDNAGVMVGFGEGGLPRPDVQNAIPEIASSATGWSALSPTAAKTYQVFGIDLAAGSACLMGTLKPSWAVE